MCFHNIYRCIVETIYGTRQQSCLIILEPDEEFCEYYINTVSRIKELIKAKNEVTKMSEEEINQMINEFEDLPSNGDTLH